MCQFEVCFYDSILQLDHSSEPYFFTRRIVAYFYGRYWEIFSMRPKPKTSDGEFFVIREFKILNLERRRHSAMLAIRHDEMGHMSMSWRP